MTGRSRCACSAEILTVHISGRLVVLCWPHVADGEVGEYAVHHTGAGGYSAMYVPTGQPVHLPYFRYAIHQCPLAVQPPDISEPRHEPPGAAGREQWRQAVSAHSKDKRNQRGRRPGKPITGYRIPPRSQP